MGVEMHRSDLGTALRVRLLADSLVMDLSSATLLKLILTTPEGAVEEHVATFATDGTDGRIQYVTQLGDLDTVGVWKLQAYVEQGGGAWHSEVGKFRVWPNLN